MDFSKVKAVMFDFDGTLTPKGQHQPDASMIDLIIEVGKKIPFSFCTGRDVISFRRDGLQTILDRLEPKDAKEVLSNLFYVGENGAVGYRYDLEANDLKQFYDVRWPEEFISRKGLMDSLDEECSEFGSVIYDAHKIVVVVRTNVVDTLQEMKGNVEKIYEYSAKLEEICDKFLSKFNPNYKDFIQVGNSGVGIVISPAGGNKNQGTKELVKYLEKERNFSFEKDARDVVVIGDRPEVGGNDHYFLNGEIGSAFTVGHILEGKNYPKPVIDENGKRLIHADGTAYILKKIINS